MRSPPSYADSSTLSIIGYVVLVGSLLGILTNMAKAALLAGWTPLPFLFWSTLIGGILLLARAASIGQAPQLSKPHLLYYAVSGLFSFAVPNALSFAAMPHVGASFIAFCLAFPPLLTYFFALLLRLEAFVLIRGIGIAFGLAGALWLAIGKGSGNGGAIEWVLIASIAPVFIAIGNVYRSLRWPTGATPLSLAPGMMIAASLQVALYLGAMAASTEASWLAPFVVPLDGALWGYGLAQGVILAVTYAAFFSLQKLGGPVALSQIGWVGAAIGASIAVIVLDEEMPLMLWAAMGLIAIGIICVSWKR